MKSMMTDGLFSSRTDEWETPQEFFNMLDTEFHFNLDPCASDENHKCDKYYTIADDGISKNWGGTECSVIRLTAENFRNGLRRLMRRAENLKRLWLCLFRQEQIQGGFMIISTEKPKSGLFVED